MAKKVLSLLFNVRGIRIEGRIAMAGEDIHHPDIAPPLHRCRFGWVAQKPNPFPRTIHDNIAYPALFHGLVRDKAETDAHVEHCLTRARLWNDVKDDLHRKRGTDLSGGQQQRLCIARALSTRPEVLLLDEPTGSIDPSATAAIEDLLVELKEECATVITTHSMMEARRIADRVAFFDLGQLLEIGPTAQVFYAPRTRRCAEFIRGQMG